MSKLNNINFLDYLNDSDSESDIQILETYSNGNISDLTYEYCDNNSHSYDKCIINSNEKLNDGSMKSIYQSNTCKIDLSKNPISSSEKEIFKNCKSSYEIDENESIDDCMSFNSQISNKKVNYVNVKNNNIEIRQIYLQKKIEQLEILGNSFKKIGHSIEYYKYSLENSKDIILRETDEEASILLNDTSLNLYNIILLEVKKNINSSKLRFITFENVKLYEVPKIDLQFSEGIIKFSIIDNKKIYNYKIGCKYVNSDDLEESIDDVVQESNYVFNYFNSRFNKISTIINYIKINSL